MPKKPDASLATSSGDIGAPECILLSIGCDKYPPPNELTSAENDARSVFDALTDGKASIYDPRRSSLLLSPKKAEIEKALLDTLKQHKPVDVFAFYFAGHGIMQGGSFYICPSDTELDAISVTAINVSNILRTICEIKPRQAYIILDACFSGGASLDLMTVLRPDFLAQSPSFGISVLAAANLTKGAIETDQGGLFTEQLVNVLCGSLVVNDTEPFLGLGEIVRKLPQGTDLKDQGPNFWDLNLTGADIFCRNPSFIAGALTQSTDFGSLRYSSTQKDLNPELSRDVWRAFLELPDFDFEKVCFLFSQFVSEHLKGSQDLQAAVDAVARSFASAVAANADTFAPSLIHVAMTRALLPHVALGDPLRIALKSQTAAAAHEALVALRSLDSALDVAPRALLSRHGGYSELYYLPLRVSELLGWIGFVSTIYRDPAEQSFFRNLVKKLLSQYGNSVVAVSDDQAPPLLSFLTTCKKLGWIEEAEEVIGRLYLDFNSNNGRVLINGPSAAEILDYILLKQAKPVELNAPFLQNPSELLSVILLGAAIFELDDEIDRTLIQLDHAHFAFYIPDSFAEFSETRMVTGRTVVYQLGHGLWSINDVRRTWHELLSDLVKSAVTEPECEVQLAAHLLSLVLTDRLPLFTISDVPAVRTSIPRI